MSRIILWGKGRTLAKVTKAIAALPPEVSDDQREKAGQKVIDRQAAKQQLVEEGLREVPRHARRMLQDFDYDTNETAEGIEARVKAQVEKELRKELDGSESRKNVVDRVRDIMEDLEHCE
jgi:hypothetical protein